MGRKNNKALKHILFLLLILSACKKDKPHDTVKLPPADTTNSVYVVCEGSFGSGNSSLGLYTTKDGMAYEDVYKSTNSEPVGDVLQSMQLIGDRYFLCVNNSDKIIVINKSDRKKAGTIGVPKPRYILPVSDDKAYVSTLFSNKVYVINPKTLSVTGSFQMPYKNPEGMLLLNGKAYICTWDTACNKLYQVNINSDVIEKEISLAGSAPQDVLADRDNRLWVLSGNVTQGKKAALTCIDVTTGAIVKSCIFPDKADPLRPVLNKTKDKLYFIEVNYTGGTDNNGIYSMGIEAVSIPAAPLIPAVALQYFWALGVDHKTGNLYIGDPKGFTQKGAVYIYDSTGNKLNTFAVGVGPGHFYFDN